MKKTSADPDAPNHQQGAEVSSLLLELVHLEQGFPAEELSVSFQQVTRKQQVKAAPSQHHRRRSSSCRRGPAGEERRIFPTSSILTPDCFQPKLPGTTSLFWLGKPMRHLIGRLYIVNTVTLSSQLSYW